MPPISDRHGYPARTVRADAMAISRGGITARKPGPSAPRKPIIDLFIEGMQSIPGRPHSRSR